MGALVARSYIEDASTLCVMHEDSAPSLPLGVPRAHKNRCIWVAVVDDRSIGDEVLVISVTRNSGSVQDWISQPWQYRTVNAAHDIHRSL